MCVVFFAVLRGLCPVDRPALLGIVLMLLVYRTGGNGEVNFNEVTMANLQQESTR